MKGGHKICEIEETSQISSERLKVIRHESYLYRMLLHWVASLYCNLTNNNDFDSHDGGWYWYNTAFSEMFDEIGRMRTQRDNWRTLAELFMLGFITICAIFIFYALNWH